MDYKKPRNLSTPILFLTFNRPDTTKIVFQKIRNVRPRKLYFASDGPRQQVAGEKETVEKLRKTILKNIDWECEVKTLFREENMGCKHAVSSAITWFFETEEMGIILEDDCVPDESFFFFCEKLLWHYQDTPELMMVAGTNFQISSHIPWTYLFSRYFPIWGWATWRRAWNLYDLNMNGWEKYKNRSILSKTFKSSRARIYLSTQFDAAKKGKINTWDIQWAYTCITNNGLCAVPRNNLISNIGIKGTHYSRQSPLHHMDALSIETNELIHPVELASYEPYDMYVEKIIGSEITFKQLVKYYRRKIGLTTQKQ